MKNRKSLIIARLLIVFVLFGSLGFSVQVNSADVNTREFLEERAAIVKPGVLPNSFWYWADVFGEEIRFLATVGKERKADYLIDLAAERLAELKALSEQGIGKYADDLLIKHDDKVQVAEKLYQQVREQGLQKAQELQVDVEEEIIRQEIDFKQAARQAPEQYKAKRDGFISRVGAGFKKVLGHLDWKKDKIQEQKAGMYE